MIYDNLTITILVWAVVTIAIIARLGRNGCRIKKMLGKPCKK